MSVIFIVLPLATIVVLVAVIAFVVAARRGQFDDLVTPSIRMLHDDEAPPAAGVPDRSAAPANGPPPTDPRGA